MSSFLGVIALCGHLGNWMSAYISLFKRIYHRAGQPCHPQKIVMANLAIPKRSLATVYAVGHWAARRFTSQASMCIEWWRARHQSWLAMFHLGWLFFLLIYEAPWSLIHVATACFASFLLATRWKVCHLASTKLSSCTALGHAPRLLLGRRRSGGLERKVRGQKRQITEEVAGQADRSHQIPTKMVERRSQRVEGWWYCDCFRCSTSGSGSSAACI